MTIIIWDAAITFLILKIISLFTSLRMTDEQLEIGDLAVHGEEAYPDDGLVSSGGLASQRASRGPDLSAGAEFA